MSTKGVYTKGDPILGRRNQSPGLGSRFISESRAIHISGNGSDMDMDTSSDSDDEVYGRVVSSPQDDKIPNANVRVFHKAAYCSEGYISSVHSQANVTATTAKKDFYDGESKNPSAPLFVGSVRELNQATEHVFAPGADCSTPCPVDSDGSGTTDEPIANKSISSEATASNYSANRKFEPRTTASESSKLSPALFPTYHATGLGPWSAVISYDACVRLCLYSWARKCTEAPTFLEDECALLKNAFGLQHVLLQPEQDLLRKPSPGLVSEEAAAPKIKKTFGKMKVQVRKVKMVLDPPSGCSFSPFGQPMVKLESVRTHMSNMKSTVSSGWGALRKVRVTPQIPANGSFSSRSLAYLHAGTQYLKEVSGVLKVGATTSSQNSSSSYEVVQETYACSLRLKSSSEEDAIRMQPGSGEDHMFLPDGLGDDLIIEVYDSKAKNIIGRVVVQVAPIAENPVDKLRWWPIYHEPEHELVGRIQLYINYSTSPGENSHLKCGIVSETVAYDSVLEVAMKVQNFRRRNLSLHGPWKWLVTAFISYYGVSDAYSKLRYLSYVMDVATPTADCLELVHEMLLPVFMKGDLKHTLSHQENRILGEVSDRIEQILALVFENYKSLDESLPTGMVDAFGPASRLAAPALNPALKLYNLLHDVLSPEVQLKLCRYFQTATKKRSRRHLAETDELISANNEHTLTDSVSLSTAYQRMKSLCLCMKKEILTDIEIHNQQLLPSFIDLPNLSASIYSVELCNRVREFLVSCSPAGLSPPVAELVIATSDFQRDLACWNINPIKGGVDAKELFHLYIIRWIQDKRLSLLESCKLDKVKWSGANIQHSTASFLDDMYEKLNETLNQYEVIISRWPEYTLVLEKAIADVERAILETLDKQYSDILLPLKENLAPFKLGLKYVQRIAKTTVFPYTVPVELGVLLNSMKRMFDVLQPRVEARFRSWGSCIPGGGNDAPGEYVSEVTVMIRTKFRNYVQAVVEKLAENTRTQNATKLRKIIVFVEENAGDSDVRSKMQPLNDMLLKTIDHLHVVFESHVFIIVCRGFWDRMGLDMLRFLETRKENTACYKGSRTVVSILDETFGSEMQQLLGNSLQEKDLEPPRSIMQVRSMLCKDSVDQKDSNYFY